MTKIDELKKTVEILRSENGCPWDRASTFETLKRYLLEEAAETAGAVNIFSDTGNTEFLKEELGDVLLQIVMYSRIAEEKNLFELDDVISAVNEKMISRHPHVFGDDRIVSEDELNRKWELKKQKEKEGLEWTEKYTEEAFREAHQLLNKGQYRKGFMLAQAEELKKRYHLSKHPEGGWFSEVYTAPGELGTLEKNRRIAGSIYFLLEGNDVSHFHVIDTDEIWYYHSGCGLDITCINPDGMWTVKHLGTEENAEPMALIPAGTIFAAECTEKNGYTLMSCVTVPSFSYSGFRLVPQEELLSVYPQHKYKIAVLAFHEKDTAL